MSIIVYAAVADCVDPPDGANYAGNNTYKAANQECELWKDVTYDGHSYNQGYLFPNDNPAEAARNYCRNPSDPFNNNFNGRASGVWCFMKYAANLVPTYCVVLDCGE